jgi:hypothetical protein
MDGIVTDRLSGIARALGPQEQEPRDQPRKKPRRPAPPQTVAQDEAVEDLEHTPHKIDSLA